MYIVYIYMNDIYDVLHVLFYLRSVEIIIHTEIVEYYIKAYYVNLLKHNMNVRNNNIKICDDVTSTKIRKVIIHIGV